MTVLDWFLEPAAPRARDDAVVAAASVPAETPSPGAACAAITAAVLGRPGAVEPVAGALAAVLRRRGRFGAAVLAVLDGGVEDLAGRPVESRERGFGEPAAGGEPPAECPAAAAGSPRRARRRVAQTVERLELRGVRAVPRGRLVRAHLSSIEQVPAAQRAAPEGTPAVLAVAAARTPPLDALLSGQDLLVLVAEETTAPVAVLARTELAALGPPVIMVPPLPTGLAGAMARLGLLPGRLGRELDEVLGAAGRGQIAVAG